MSSTIKVSVCIPVYNKVQYIGRCLDSILSQTLKEIEIIAVDDCSTDDSLSILEDYAKRDRRIVVISSE
ncbi:MAG: glycosyltransferase family 2 protein, partial [Opitutales bacterium]|nr:glycosyltransferase family 2 protein [Opitutales bacterium]